ncbi:MAG: hypothetical protein PUB71_07030 [Hallerella succinigenes]|uniref:DUF4417 domain-containing protein n=1 Tax=Hallerella succinigenes TaxID=1896222 RepID=UPI0023F14383|nr:DUF4417 domain-containing protein [Hallerella succinigenes]MDD6092241.1 hypothetical protein [Hallerella succinigenes]
MVKNLVDLLKVSEEYIRYLERKEVKFNSKGFPLLRKEMFLDEYPELVLPYDFRKNTLVADPKKTLLCFYCGDKRIYPRLKKVLKDIPEYKRFLGVVTIDITVTSDMDEEWQNAIMLLHQLFMAVLAVNGVKVVANLRTGDARSAENLNNMPKGIMWAAGFLGCAEEDPLDFRFISSTLRVMPSKLVVYGPEDEIALGKLNMMGFDYRVYDDYHKLSKKYKRSA